MEAVINEALKERGAPNVSDSHTINGKPGPLFNCPTKGKRLGILYLEIFRYIVYCWGISIYMKI